MFSYINSKIMKMLSALLMMLVVWVYVQYHNIRKLLDKSNEDLDENVYNDNNRRNKRRNHKISKVNLTPQRENMIYSAGENKITWHLQLFSNLFLPS